MFQFCKKILNMGPKKNVKDNEEEARLKIMQRIQELVDKNDPAIELQDFVSAHRAHWSEKMNFEKPIFNGKDYDLAVCKRCQLVIDARVGSITSSHQVFSHYYARDKKRGDCATRRKMGMTFAESIGAEVTPAKRVEIQKALDNFDAKSIEENSRTFIGRREDWTEKYGFRQPILNGVAYEIAFCTSCKVLLDAKGGLLDNHRNGREAPNGACQKRKRELGLSQPELEGEKALQVAKRDECQRRKQNPSNFVSRKYFSECMKTLRTMEECEYCDKLFDDVEIEYHRIVCRRMLPVNRRKDPNKPATEAEIAECKAKGEEALAKYLKAERIWRGRKKKANLEIDEDEEAEDEEDDDDYEDEDEDEDEEDEEDDEEDEDEDEEDEEDDESLAKPLKKDYQKYYRCGSTAEMQEKSEECVRCKLWYSEGHYFRVHFQECVIKRKDVQFFKDQSFAPEDHPDDLYFEWQLGKQGAYECHWPECHKVFPKLQRLENHWKCHTCEKSYCSKCDKSFVSSYYAKMCQLSHSSISKADVKKLVAKNDASLSYRAASKRKDSNLYKHFKQIRINKKKTVFLLCKSCKTVVKYSSASEHLKNRHA